MNKLVDEYNNIYHHSISKKPFDVDYSALTEKIESVHKALKFKVRDRIRITKHKNSLAKFTLKIDQKIFVIDSLLQLVLRRIKLKI